MGKCDKCGAALDHAGGRPAGSIRKRLDVYQETTKPLLDYYEKKGDSEDCWTRPQSVQRVARRSVADLWDAEVG